MCSKCQRRLYFCRALILHRLRVFENRALGRKLGPKREEVAGGWRKLHKKKLHNLAEYYAGVQTRRMSRMCHVSRMGKVINTYNILVGKPEGERTWKT